MKLTTQRLLIALYSQNGESVQFPYQVVQLLLPELTSGGQRSLIHLLHLQDYLHKETVANSIALTLSQMGSLALERQFPALKLPVDSWKGQWQLLVFLKPPNEDKNFRFLRNLILSNHGLPVSRGVFGFADQVPGEVDHVIKNLYKQNILIIAGAPQLGFGSLRQIIIDYYRLPDLISAYSGVSKEISQLLSVNRSLEELTDGQKRAIHSILIRICQIATQDPGIIRFYFPGHPNLSEVLENYQLLLKTVFRLV